MQRFIKRTQYLYHASVEQMVEAGYDIGDGGRQEQAMGEDEQAQLVLNRLTRRQRQVAELLRQGYTRREIAEDHLNVCLQAIHQIIPRMRKRLLEGGIGHEA